MIYSYRTYCFVVRFDLLDRTVCFIKYFYPRILCTKQSIRKNLERLLRYYVYLTWLYESKRDYIVAAGNPRV